jgi:dolichol-phosphate mannosyltransferase
MPTEGTTGLNTDRTLVIVPTYNEKDNIPSLVEQVLAVVPDADFLLVDDNSPDGTADLAESLFGSDIRFSVLRRTGLRGLGRSYVDGYRHAIATGYARVVQMDADFSHDPKYIPSLIKAAEVADVVLGSRYCAGGGVTDWPMRRLLLSKFANFYVAVVTGLPVRDATAGFRCYSRRALERIHIDEIVSNGYAFQVEMTHRAKEAGLRIAETPIIFTDRLKGQSKISRAVLIESMVIPWKLRLGQRRRRLRTAQHSVDK